MFWKIFDGHIAQLRRIACRTVGDGIERIATISQLAHRIIDFDLRRIGSLCAISHQNHTDQTLASLLLDRLMQASSDIGFTAQRLGGQLQLAGFPDLRLQVGLVAVDFDFQMFVEFLE